MYYIYKTTNLINNKIYIGFHKSDDIKNDNYMGSGVLISKAIKKYGTNNFKREILFSFENMDKALQKEAELVNEEFANREDTYNVKTGGKLGWNINGPHNKNKISIYSPITNSVYYTNTENLQSFLENGWELGSGSKGRKCIILEGVIKYVTDDELELFLNLGWKQYNQTSGRICMTGPNDNLKYIKQDEVELYEKMGYVKGNMKSGINKGTVYVSKDNKNKRIKLEELDDYLKKGWNNKRYQKPSSIKRMYNPETGILKNIKQEEVDEYLKNGWVKGLNYVPNKKRIYITKDSVNKMINPVELESYLEKGWKKGMYNKRYN
jgi:hypothetical protein